MERRSKKCCCCCKRRTCACGTVLCVFIASIIIAALSSTAYCYFPQEFNYILNAEVSLTPHSATIKPWAEVKSNYTIYVFSVVNAHDVEHHGHKPILKELGPFTYYRDAVKYDLFWSEDKNVLQYSHNITYSDIPGFNTSVPITTINLPLIGMLALVDEIENNPKYEKLKIVLELLFETADWINEVLQIEPLFVTKTVDELLWGYEDPLYKLVHELDPTLLPTANFSLMHRATHLFPNQVYTGKNDSSLRDGYIMWNGLHEIKEWGTPTARSFHNSTKAIFTTTNLKKTATIRIFTDQLKMTGYFTYKEDVNIQGLNCYRYIYPKKELDNTTIDKGFYPNGPSGVLNLSAIAPFNLPLFASKPHFLDGDPFYLQDINITAPVRSKHDSYIDVEPITGTVVSGAKQLQINIRVERRKEYKQLENMPEYLMLPIFYTSQEGEIQQDQAHALKQTLNAINEGTKTVLLILISISGLVTLVVSAVFIVLCSQRIYRYRRYHYERMPLLDRANYNTVQ